jgi:3,4-dihydroxy 2-butanone 4-phosphate synthase/GTP cyclohydrolase II
MLHEYVEKASRLADDAGITDHPIYGTTIYLANCQLETIFGTFTAYVFQDVIHKGHIIALAHGEIATASVLYTRIHSSCVTSETLRGSDCDCVQQLEGAIERIAQKGCGVLFYLIQEGRGVGYISKSRDRMLVQATNDGISTFRAYEMIGLKKDYRDYRNVRDICEILNLKAGWVIFTNNPDKISAMKNQGLEVVGTEAIEYDPGPFNLAYLASKAESGHILEKPQHTELESIIPPEPVIPFKPHALPEIQRFIYASSYFLPIKPVEGEVVVSTDDLKAWLGDRSLDSLLEGDHPLVHHIVRLKRNRYRLHINEKALVAHRRANPGDPLSRLLTTPYWFRVHVYYDIVTDLDYVVLTHGTITYRDSPIVRIQSESIFNRFPLKDMDNRDKYKGALREIVQEGCGVILLLYNDGRGAGLGAHVLDKMMTQHGITLDSESSYETLGVGYDVRDYEATMRLLRHHIPSNRLQMIMNSPNSLLKKPEYADALNSCHMTVERWIFLEEKGDSEMG